MADVLADVLCDSCGQPIASALHDLRYKSPLVHAFKFPPAYSGE